jgi:hypothetical protein
VSGTWFDTHGQACRTISFVIKESCSPHPRVVSSIARRSFIKRRMSDQTSCCAPGGLPTAGQRYGRERRPARRVPVTDLLMQLDFRQVTRVEQSMEVPPSVFDWKDWAAPMLAQ